MALASGGIAFFCLLVAFGLRALHSTGAVPAGAVSVVPYLIVVVYLALVGRGALGRIAGAGCWLVAGALSVIPVIAPWAFIRTDAGAILMIVLSAFGVVLATVGWGVARRDGWLWLVSVPAALVMWALLNWGLGPAVRERWGAPRISTSAPSCRSC
ncbi:hypothetical protein [Tsukamurella sp. PLM1]|uniref:hypothetical protein n=1 Tax=Tsukamurella sp. PLM1 TaxID=2929795 RepID=UPI002049F781|nr:hypothetical protein [Tsukamurella sp. PLM1]BDH57018.1 hypothetical protein MTP03_19570 [Tsukamurella sp. PLM1]